MKKLFVLFSLLLTISVIQAQYLSIYKIDTTQYPFIKANFIAIDNKGNIINNLNKEDVEIWENDKKMNVIRVTNYENITPVPVSIMLTVDISGSMSGSSIEIVQEALIPFIDKMPLDLFECAVTSFNHNSFIKNDFCKKKERILNSIKSLETYNGTDYDNGFYQDISGVLKLAEKAKYKKVIIFISDGYGICNAETVIKQAQSEKIRIFCITTDKMPESLKQVSQKTNALFFENINTSKTLHTILSIITNYVQNLQPSLIEWESQIACSENRKVTFKAKNLNSDYSEYNVAYNKTARIEINPAVALFGKINSGSKKDIELTITAKNYPITVKNIKNLNSESFSLNISDSFPFVLQFNQSKKINLSFLPKDSGFVISKIIIENNLCPDIVIHATGGYPNKKTKTKSLQTLKLLFPNGGEEFSAGTDTTIRWQSFSKSDNYYIDYSSDYGENWTNCGYAKGLYAKWNIPLKLSYQYLIKIRQKPVDESAIQLYTIHAHNQTITDINFNNSENRIISTSYDGTSKIWDANEGTELKSFRLHETYISGAHFLPDNKHIITFGIDNKIHLTHISTSKKIRSFMKHKKLINAVHISNDGKKMISAGIDKTAYIWDIETGKRLFKIKHKAPIIQALFSKDGKSILIAGGRWLCVYNTENHKLIFQIPTVYTDITCADINYDGTKVILGTTASIFLVDNTGSYIRVENLPATIVKFNHDGSRYLTYSPGMPLKIFHTNTGNFINELPKQAVSYTKAVFSSDNSQIITSSYDGKIKCWIFPSELTLDEDISDRPFTVTSPSPGAQDVIFGQTLLGYYSDLIVPKFIFNPSPLPLYIKSIEITGENASEFQIISQLPPYTIKPFDSKQVEFRYKPTTEGSFCANLNIVTPKETLEKKICGKATLILFDLINKIDFGQVWLKKYRDTIKSVFSNEGIYPIKVTKIVNGGPDTIQFRLLDNPQKITLREDERLPLHIAFKPKERGLATGSIHIYIEGLNSPLCIPLYGEGLAPERIKIYGTIYDSNNNLPLEADVSCSDLQSNRELKRIKTNKSGYYSFTSDMDRMYSIVAGKNGYLASSDFVDLSEQIMQDSIKRDIFLSRFEIGAKVRMNNIFFEFGKSVLSSISTGELDRLFKLLKDYPKMQITIDGHTDNIGTTENNTQLSQARANAVKNYLTKKGIESNRLTAIGHGSNKPVVKNDTEENRQMNRRVEFSILNK